MCGRKNHKRFLKLKISVGQIDISLGNPRVNLRKAAELVAAASNSGSRAVLFPELFTTGYSGNIAELAESIRGMTVDFLSREASRNNIFVIGTIPVVNEGNLYNTCVVIGPTGLLGYYRKVHLIGLLGEDKMFRPGDSYAVYHTDLGTIGTVICYDIRFPEICRPVALAGAEILFVPAEWPYPRLNHWRGLLIARAVENQIFVAGCNRVGADKTNKYFGHSMIVDPMGEILTEGDEYSEKLLTAELDFDVLSQFRSIIPCFKDRKPNAYVKRIDFGN